MAATFPEMTRTVSLGPLSESSTCPQSQRSHSVVSIALYNENGEDDVVEIDEADDVFQEPVNTRLSSCNYKLYFSLIGTHISDLNVKLNFSCKRRRYENS